MAVKEQTCHFCGQPAVCSIESREIKRRRFICMEDKCWRQYHAERETGK